MQENRPPLFSRDNISLNPPSFHPLPSVSLCPSSLIFIILSTARRSQCLVAEIFLTRLLLFGVCLSPSVVCTRSSACICVHAWQGCGFSTDSSAVWKMLHDVCQAILNIGETPFPRPLHPFSLPSPLPSTMSAVVSVSYYTFHWDFGGGDATSDVWGSLGTVDTT